MHDNHPREQARKRFWRRLSFPIRFCIGGSIAFLCLYLPVLVLFGNPFGSNPFDDLAFDRKIWQEDASCVDGSNRRGRMAEDLLRHKLKGGMTPEQIETFLGKPGHSLHKSEMSEWPSRFQPEDAQAELILEYHVGDEFTFGSGVTFVDLFFDKQGHYVRGRIFSPPDDLRDFAPE